jgi:hypothetical protein
LKRTSTAIGFFYFYLEHLIRVQSSEPLHAKMNPTSCSFGSWLAYAQTAIFSAKPYSKKAGETSIVLWIILRLGVKNYNIPQSKPCKIEQLFGGFFHQIKVCQPIGRQDSMQTVNFCMKWLRSLKSFEIFKSEIKGSKTYSG